MTSALLPLLSAPEGHYQVKLAPTSLERFTIWMDTYAQKLGSFTADQEHRLEELRRACSGLLTDVPPGAHTTEAERPFRTAALAQRKGSR